MVAWWAFLFFLAVWACISKSGILWYMAICHEVTHRGRRWKQLSIWVSGTISWFCFYCLMYGNMTPKQPFGKTKPFFLFDLWHSDMESWRDLEPANRISKQPFGKTKPFFFWFVAQWRGVTWRDVEPANPISKQPFGKTKPFFFWFVAQWRGVTWRDLEPANPISKQPFGQTKPFFYLICGTVTWSHMERLGTCKPNFKTTIWQNQTIFFWFVAQWRGVTWRDVEPANPISKQPFGKTKPFFFWFVAQWRGVTWRDLEPANPISKQPFGKTKPFFFDLWHSDVESHGETWNPQTQFQNNHLAKPNHFFYLICGTVTWSHMERLGTCKPNFKTTIWQNQTIFFWFVAQWRGVTWRDVEPANPISKQPFGKTKPFFFDLWHSDVESHGETWNLQTQFQNNHLAKPNNFFLICGTVTWSHMERLGTCKPNFKTTIWQNQTIFFILFDLWHSDVESPGETWNLQTNRISKQPFGKKPNHFFLICGTVTWSHMERRGTC